MIPTSADEKIVTIRFGSEAISLKLGELAQIVDAGLTATPPGSTARRRVLEIERVVNEWRVA